VRLCQLYALRAQVDALILGEEAEGQNGQPPSMVDPGACPKCGAPEDKQVVAPTMGGGVTVACQVCKAQRTR
jgi:hypothetical protein